MKKPLTIQQSYCDFCGEKASGYQLCLSCGRDFCYDCARKHGVEYNHGVHCAGSGDGLYCLECDQKMREKGDRLHSAYVKIHILREQEKSFYEDFKTRCEAAENELKTILYDHKKD
jgi:hypothetical protein